ncbi:MAG: D-alanyl-D-alanine carboxypeptidase/D-alanyl-D-alanine-endopeptidase [Bdellovibrionales bacterium]
MVQKSGVDQKYLSILVSTEAFSGDIEVYQLNSTQRIPASVTKIITAAASLKLFPENHKFVTQLVSNGEIKEGVLKGDLVIVGGGNPSFVSENLWELVNEFKRNNVTKIDGHIVVDDSLFDNIRFDPSRLKARVNRADDAPIGAMSFNWNSVNVFVRPGEKSGVGAKVYLDPENNYYDLVNEVKTTSGKGAKIRLSRKGVRGFKEEITVSGEIGLQSPEQVRYMSVLHPDYWVGYNLETFLRQRGITVTGVVKTGQAPKNAKIFADHESKPIADIVKDMMKFSNNYVAEMLTKNLASLKHPGKPASLNDGVKELRNFMAKQGVDKKNFQLVNPSGLSRDNLVRAQDISQLLESLQNQFQIFPEFLTSMPISGVDGTLKRRMNGDSVKGWVRAKTGMLSGVVGLAGYAKSKNTPLFTYVFFYNGPAKLNNKAKELADQIAAGLVDES